MFEINQVHEVFCLMCFFTNDLNFKDCFSNILIFVEEKELPVKLWVLRSHGGSFCRRPAPLSGPTEHTLKVKNIKTSWR